MNYLIDTHVLLWFMDGNNLLSQKIIEILENKNSKCFISTASIWEIAIKISLNKLFLELEFHELNKYIADNDFEILDVNFNHYQNLINLEFIHKDPFDRIIIAQAQSEKMILFTKDENIKLYKDLKIIW